MKNNILFITNWEYITFKNNYQINYLSKKFDKILIFTPDKLKHAKKICNNYTNMRLINNPSSLARFLIFIFYIFKYCNINLTSIISPYGHSSFFYFIILSIFNSTKISIEWGPIDILEKKNFLEKRFSSYIFKKSNYVWYKEHYMKNKLISLNKNLFFLPNITSNNFPILKFYEKKIDFLWFNNFDNRFPNLFIESLKISKFKKKINCVMIGDYNNKLKKFETNNHMYSLQILNFSDDRSYLYQAKFFVLFAKRIFGNNSLLESMSSGAIPIVSKVSDSGNLVTNNLSGYIVENDKNKISSLLEKIHILDQSHWSNLSNNCIKKINSEYNTNNWNSNADKLFNKCV